MTTTVEQGPLEDLVIYIEAIENAENAASRRAAFNDMQQDLQLVNRLAGLDEDGQAELARLLNRLTNPTLRVATASRQYNTSITRARRSLQQQRVNAAVERLTETDRVIDATQLPANLLEQVAQFVVPGGYDMSLDGVYKLSVRGDGEINRTMVCPRIILITGQGKDSKTGAIQTTVSWVESGSPVTGAPRWKSKTLGREQVFDSKKLIALSGLGAPITSIDVSDVVRWLRDFEQANAERIPIVNGTTRLGWQADGSFMLPDMHIKLPEHQTLTLFPPDGFREVARGWCRSGTDETVDEEWENWLTTWDTASHHPIMSIMVYASVASILLEPLARVGGEVPTPFIVDLSGRTSTGKTTAQRLAASVWGYPDESGGIISKWNTTIVGTERLAGFLHHLPLFLDESKSADYKRVSSIIYSLCNGRGRTRGDTSNRLRATATWRNCTISTGEKKITQFSKDGGTTARAICLDGRPILGTVAEGIVAARRINTGALTNYGHLGRRVATYLVQNPGSWAELKDRWIREKNDYSEFAAGNVGARLSGYAALLSLAKSICEALGLPKPNIDPIETLLKSIRTGSVASDRASEALNQCISWCDGNAYRFIGTFENVQTKRQHENFGRWDSQKSGYKGLYIRTNIIVGKLRDWGFDYDEIVPQWKSRGWLITGKRENSFTTNVRVTGNRGGSIGCVCIRREVIENLTVITASDTGALPKVYVDVPGSSDTLHVELGDSGN